MQNNSLVNNDPNFNSLLCDLLKVRSGEIDMTQPLTLKEIYGPALWLEITSHSSPTYIGLLVRALSETNAFPLVYQGKTSANTALYTFDSTFKSI
jgi:hypothetical protein